MADRPDQPPILGIKMSCSLLLVFMMTAFRSDQNRHWVFLGGIALCVMITMFAASRPFGRWHARLHRDPRRRDRIYATALLILIPLMLGLAFLAGHAMLKHREPSLSLDHVARVLPFNLVLTGIAALAADWFENRKLNMPARPSPPSA